MAGPRLSLWEGNRPKLPPRGRPAFPPNTWAGALDMNVGRELNNRVIRPAELSRRIDTECLARPQGIRFEPQAVGARMLFAAHLHAEAQLRSGWRSGRQDGRPGKAHGSRPDLCRGLNSCDPVQHWQARSVLRPADRNHRRIADQICYRPASNVGCPVAKRGPESRS
jgi:hypothetical protein